MDYQQAIAQLRKLKRDLPDIVGAEFVGFSLDSIRAESYIGRPWPGRKSGSPRNLGRGLLVDTGNGRRSIRYVKAAPYVLLETVDYMAAHNEGARIHGTFRVRAHNRRAARGTVQVRAHNRTVDFRLPERRFIGRNSQLSRRIFRILDSRIKSITR